jgi:NADH-quinone oxidoreductase subunit M
MFQRTMFNDRGDDEVKPSFGLKDLGAREIASLVPLVVFVIWMGVYPQTFLEFLHVPVQVILDRVTPSLNDTSASVSALAQLVDSVRGLF